MIRAWKPLALAAALLGAWGVAPAWAGATFDLDDLEPGTPTPFAETRNGITATFSSPALDPSGFVTIPGPTFAPPFSGTSVLDSAAPPDAFIPLQITFSVPVTGVSLDFATDSDPSAPGTMELQAFAGGPQGTEVGLARVAGIIPADGFVPQGSIGITSAIPFDTVVLTDAADPAFAVGNLTVTTPGGTGLAAVPEPSSLALLALGVATALGHGWRSRRARHS